VWITRPFALLLPLRRMTCSMAGPHRYINTPPPPYLPPTSYMRNALLTNGWSATLHSRCPHKPSGHNATPPAPPARLSIAVQFDSIQVTDVTCGEYGGLFLPMLPNDSPLNHSTTPIHSTLPWITPLSSNSLHSPLIHSTLPQFTPLSLNSLHSPLNHSTLP